MHGGQPPVSPEEFAEGEFDQLLGVGVPTAASDHPRFAWPYITTSGPRFFWSVNSLKPLDCDSRQVTSRTDTAHRHYGRRMLPREARHTKRDTVQKRGFVYSRLDVWTPCSLECAHECHIRSVCVFTTQPHLSKTRDRRRAMAARASGPPAGRSTLPR